MVGFTSYVKSKTSDLKLHHSSKKEVDGKTEESTLVHRALVEFYTNRNQSIPPWLEQDRKSYSSSNAGGASNGYMYHSRHSSVSSGPLNRTSRTSLSEERSNIRPQVGPSSPSHQAMPQRTLNHANTSSNIGMPQRTGSLQTVTATRNSSGSNAERFNPPIRSKTTNDVSLSQETISRSSTKSRRRFG